MYNFLTSPGTFLTLFLNLRFRFFWDVYLLREDTGRHSWNLKFVNLQAAMSVKKGWGGGGVRVCVWNRGRFQVRVKIKSYPWFCFFALPKIPFSFLHCEELIQPTCLRHLWGGSGKSVLIGFTNAAHNPLNRAICCFCYWLFRKKCFWFAGLRSILTAEKYWGEKKDKFIYIPISVGADCAHVTWYICVPNSFWIWLYY